MEVTRGQDEGCHSCIHQGDSLDIAIPDPMILRQNDPATPSYLGEPFYISCIGGEIIVMDMDNSASLPEGCSDQLCSKGTVEKIGRNFRRLQSRVRT